MKYNIFGIVEFIGGALRQKVLPNMCFCTFIGGKVRPFFAFNKLRDTIPIPINRGVAPPPTGR
jgi:hypothetical protein